MFVKSLALALSLIALSGFSLWSSIEDLNKQKIFTSTQDHGFYIPEEHEPIARLQTTEEQKTKPINAKTLTQPSEEKGEI